MSDNIVRVNKRRFFLIEKELEEDLTAAEVVELDALQEEIDALVDLELERL